jgi:lambda family phage portal protein
MTKKAPAKKKTAAAPEPQTVVIAASNKSRSVGGYMRGIDDIRADYEMSRESRFIRRRNGLAPSGGSADYHYRVEEHYYRDIEKARDMDRNDTIIGQTIDRAVSNEVQDGFSLDPQTGDKVLNDELWSRWKEFSEDPDLCDISGEYTWHDYEMHASRSQKLDGDCVVLGIEEMGCLQFIEAHEVQTKSRQENTFLGVTLGQYGDHERYWIMQDPILPQGTKADSVPVDVRNAEGHRQLFHVYNAKRMNQTRGVTALAPIFSLSGMFEDIQFAKLVQQQTVSCFAIFREQAVVNGGGLPTVRQGYGNSTQEISQAGTRYIEDIAPGMEIIGRPGEKLHGFSPNTPNAEYFSHVRLMLQMIGVNLGLPLCLVLMDGSETNFSGWRGAVDEARKGFRSNQVNLVNRLHNPVYFWKVRQWIDEDPALRSAFESLGNKLFAHKWNAPRWAYIDPVGDAQGDQLRLQNGLTSPRRLHAERGAEWEEVSDEIVDDMAYMIRRAKTAAAKINTEFDDGQPVQWRELANLPMPMGVQMTMQDPQALTLQEQDQQGAMTNAQ